jgi:hypothetical protein
MRASVGYPLIPGGSAGGSRSEASDPAPRQRQIAPAIEYTSGVPDGVLVGLGSVKVDQISRGHEAAFLATTAACAPQLRHESPPAAAPRSAGPS